TSHVHGSLLARGPGEPLDEWSVCRCTVNLVDLPDGSSSSPVSGLTLAPSSAEPDAHEDATDEVIATYVAGALVLTAAGIVMAAAFTTGARRQLATLGLLAANGAPPRLLRRIVAVQGLLTGAVGTVLGLGIAGTLLTAGRSLVMGVFTQHHDGLTFVP